MWTWIAIVSVTVIIVFLVGVFIRFGYRWPWTGFGETSYKKPNGELEVQPKKTLWDWLQLLGTLAIPIVLAAAGLWFTSTADKQAQHIEDQRAKAERKLAKHRAQDQALQSYLGQMGSLLLDEDLRASKEDSEISTLAQARTLTVLGRLDPTRKKAVINFLNEADLIQGTDQRLPVIALAGAELSDTNLRGVRLSGATLSNADLDGADLSDAFLDGADLSNASLDGADLSNANLNGASVDGADLSNANLNGASVGHTDMDEAVLSDAHLDDAYLGSASLWNAKLSGTSLSDANLESANLTSTSGIDQEELEQHVYSLDGAVMPNGNSTKVTPPPIQTKPEKLKNILDDEQFGHFKLDQSASRWDTESARNTGAVNGVLITYRTRDNNSGAYAFVRQFPSPNGATQKGLNRTVANYQNNLGYRAAYEFPVRSNSGKQLGQGVGLRKSNATDNLIWTNQKLMILLVCEKEYRAAQFFQDFEYQF